MQKINTYVLTALLFFSASVSFGQLSNDLCSTALAVTASADTSCNQYDGSFLNAIEESIPNMCDSTESPTAYDQWFSFTAQVENHNVDVETPNTGGFQGVGAVVEVYDACDANIIGCGNPQILDLFGFQVVQSGLTRVSLQNLSIGTNYLIRVYPYGDAIPDPGADLFTLCVNAAADAPSNDTCANAIELFPSDSCVAVTGTLDGATEGSDTSQCGPEYSGSSFDSWYKFNALEATQIINVVPTTGSDLAPVIELWDACGGSAIDCSNPTIIPIIGALPGENTLTVSNLDTTKDYLIRIYHFGNTAALNGEFDICVRNAPPAPANDTCSNAMVLTVNEDCTPTTATLESANQENNPNTCDTTSATAFDVWFSFEANERGQIIESNSGTVASVIELYDACGGNLVDCAEPQIFQGFGAIPGTTTLQSSSLDSGVTYLVRIYHFGDAIPDSPEFDICVYNVPLPPANDDCANATDVTMVDSKDLCVSTQATNIGATASANVSSCDSTEMDHDVWFKFTATSDRAVAAIDNKSPELFQTNMAFSLWADDCLTELNCFETSDVDTMLFTGLTVGVDYILRVYPTDGTSTGDFDLCVYGFPLGIPNDECNGAISITASIDDVCNATDGEFADATQEMAPNTCENLTSDNAFDQWFAFTALAAEHVVEVTTPDFGGFQGVGAVVEVYDACGGNIIGCGNPSVIQQGGFTIVRSGTTTVTLNALTVSNNYYVRVYNFGDTLPTADQDEFTICVKGKSEPAKNDICAAAELLTVEDSCVPTSATLEAANEENPPLDCNGQAASSDAKDIWFKFVASNAMQIIDVEPTGGFNGVPTMVELYEDCADSTPIYCAAPQIVGGGFPVPGLVSISTTDLTPGSTYSVRVYEYGNQASDKNFTICVYNDPTIGINEENKLFSNVYPNPTQGVVNIALNNFEAEITLRVHDAQGRVVYNSTFENVDKINADLSALKKGVYQMVLSSKTSTAHASISLK
jgi:hypothetical protein